MGRKRRLVIDGDIPLYQIGFSVETAVDWGRGLLVTQR